MPVPMEHDPVVREPKSALDRHAIAVAGRALTTAIWLERQLTRTAQRGSASMARQQWLAQPGVLFHASRPPINPTRNEEP
jgi:hypothetical protein